MSNYIGTPFDGSAVDRCCKSIVDYKGNAVAVCKACKLFYIKNRTGGIGNGLAEYGFGIRFEIFSQFLFGKSLVDECSFNSHFGHCYEEKVIGSAVY